MNLKFYFIEKMNKILIQDKCLKKHKFSYILIYMSEIMNIFVLISWWKSF